MHPLIEEICRARDVQPHALGRWQHELRTTIQPMLDELAERRDADREAYADGEAGKVDAPVAFRRGPGRPRKDEVR